MALYKIARTSGSRHIGQIYRDIHDVIEAKSKIKQVCHIYELEGKIGMGKREWILVE